MSKEKRSEAPQAREEFLCLLQSREKTDPSFILKSIRYFQDQEITLIKEGAENKEIWMLLPCDWSDQDDSEREHGYLEIFVGNQSVTKLRRYGDFVGEISALLEHETIATVHAVGIVKLFVFRLEDISSHADPEFNLALYTLFVMVLREKLRMTLGMLGKKQLEQNSLRQQINLLLKAQQASEERAKKVQEQMENFRRSVVRVLGHELITRVIPPRNFMLFACKAAEREEWKQVASLLQSSKKMFVPLDELSEKVKLVAQLLAGQVEIKKHPVNLSLLLSSAVMETRELAKENDVAVVSTNDLNATILADRKAVIVFRELIGNAIKMKCHDVQISTEMKKESVSVRVIDTGPGIPVQDLKNIFDSFIQSNRDEHEQQGLGLGLFIVQELCKLHGWTISVESELGKRSIFSIQIPIEKAALQE